LTVSTRSLPQPRFWIVAGPNGCGKSTAYDRSDVDEFGGTVWIINPDLLTSKIMDVEHLPRQDANLASVVRIEKWLEASIDAHQTIGVETVLSTGKYRRLVDHAKARGFEVRLIYVFIADPEEQLDRIRLRVAKGGHDVPKDKVLERRSKSLHQLGWFFDQADEAWIYDNGGAEPKLIGRKQGNKISLSSSVPAEMMQNLLNPKL
jgi:predicted ABC-type ATPase